MNCNFVLELKIRFCMGNPNKVQSKAKDTLLLVLILIFFIYFTFNCFAVWIGFITERKNGTFCVSSDSYLMTFTSILDHYISN